VILIRNLFFYILGFSLSKWKRDEKVPVGVRFPDWAKYLLMEYLDIAQYMNPVACQRGVGIFYDPNLNQNSTNSTDEVQNETLSSVYSSQSK
jgi:hypothetical protein